MTTDQLIVSVSGVRGIVGAAARLTARFQSAGVPRLHAPARRACLVCQRARPLRPVSVQVLLTLCPQARRGARGRGWPDAARARPADPRGVRDVLPRVAGPGTPIGDSRSPRAGARAGRRSAGTAPGQAAGVAGGNRAHAVPGLARRAGAHRRGAAHGSGARSRGGRAVARAQAGRRGCLARTGGHA